jgi:hypothetical protein
MDINNEVSPLVLGPNLPISYCNLTGQKLSIFSRFGHPNPTLLGLDPRHDLAQLQRALNWRTASVLSDEPLSIARLLSLDINYVAAPDSAEERMARVWELIAKNRGGIPPRIIFYNDNPIDIDGWRWAPRSLLTSMEESGISIDERAARFEHMTPLAMPSD